MPPRRVPQRHPVTLTDANGPQAFDLPDLDEHAEDGFHQAVRCPVTHELDTAIAATSDRAVVQTGFVEGVNLVVVGRIPVQCDLESPVDDLVSPTMF